MNEVITNMMRPYRCRTSQDYQNALKEIIQEFTLVGLWRSKFFEKGAFYGGSALRIMYGLDRFSEDLDFSLLVPDARFSPGIYLRSVKTELENTGFDVTVQEKKKHADSAIRSAFVKANTLEHLIKIGMNSGLKKKFHPGSLLRVKLEFDTNPPEDFRTEAKFLMQPFPFSVLTFCEPDLFAGKMHAVLCRGWKNRVKGRDWYDMVWFVSRSVPVNLGHLEARMRQTGHYTEPEVLTRERLTDFLHQKIRHLNIEAARKDILPFLRDPAQTEVWSHEFFRNVAEQIDTIRDEG